MKNLTDPQWWKAAAWRALRTALVIATPYAATLLYVPDQWLIVLSTAGFGALTSLITSLFGIAETSDKTPTWGWATLERVIKTAAQATLTLFGASVTFQDVDWASAPQLIGTAILGSLLLAFMKGIPEAPETPTAVATVSVASTDATGAPEVVDVPVVAPVEPVVDGLSSDH